MDPLNPPPATRPKISHESLTAIVYGRPPADDRSGGLVRWQSELTALGRPTELLVVSEGDVGVALRAMVPAAKYPLVFLAPQTGSPAELKFFLKAIDAVDVVVGCRNEPRSIAVKALGWWYRVLMTVVLGVDLVPPVAWPGWPAWRRSLGYWLLFGLRFHDAESGVQLWRREALQQLPVQSDGGFAFVELLAKANVHGALMDEVAIGRASGSAATWVGGDLRRVIRKPIVAGVPVSDVTSVA